MKNTLLVITLIALAGFSKIDAQQIVNYSFENWAIDTFAIDSGAYGSLPSDTVSFNEPIGWTSSNFLTSLDSLGHVSLVSQSSTSYGGVSAIQMVTDSIHIPPGLIHALPVSTLILPGFAISGIFPLGVSTFTSGSQINPGSVTGGGQPFTKRLASFNGYYNYTPVLNSNTGANDTCTMWATLRKGKTIVANAVFKSNANTGGYVPFAANFVYVSCEVPDTLVVLLASSAPNVYSFVPGFGSTTLQPGSRLLVDSLTYDTLADSYTFDPFTQNDIYTVYKNSIDTFNVLVNDTDCSGQALTVTIVSGPFHGTASVLANNTIQYSPAANYLGLDTITYQDKNVNNGTTNAVCNIFVNNSNGINDVTGLLVSLFPVPADNHLTIQFQNTGKCTGNIYDVVGNVVLTTELNSNTTQVNTEHLTNGIYSIEILNDQNTVIGRSKFVVAK